MPTFRMKRIDDKYWPIRQMRHGYENFFSPSQEKAPRTTFDLTYPGSTVGVEGVNAGSSLGRTAEALADARL